MVRSFSKRDRRTHWWNLTSSSSTDLLLPPENIFNAFILRLQTKFGLSFVHCRNPLSARPDFLILKQNVCNNYLRVTKTLKILQVRGKCPVSWLNTRSILKNHLGVFFEIISAIDCITNSLLKVSYCAKIGNLVISQFTSYDFIYVIKPVNDCTSGWNPQLALLLTFSPQAALY